MPSTRNGVRVSWNPRIQPCPAAVTSTNGAPERGDAQPLERPAAARASRRRRAGAARDRRRARSRPARAGRARARTSVACTPTSSASRRWPAPTSRETFAVAPYSSTVTNPRVSESSRPPSASPASARVFTCPTIAVSPSTYSGSAASAPSAGSASREDRPQIGRRGHARHSHGRLPGCASTRPGAWWYGAANGGLELAVIRPQGRPEGHWVLPKGLIEPGEAPVAAARARGASRRPASCVEPVHELPASRYVYRRGQARIFKLVEWWLMRPLAARSGRSRRRCAWRSQTRAGCSSTRRGGCSPTRASGRCSRRRASSSLQPNRGRTRRGSIHPARTPGGRLLVRPQLLLTARRGPAPPSSQDRDDPARRQVVQVPQGHRRAGADRVSASACGITSSTP